jgi:hypothetical protein
MIMKKTIYFLVALLVVFIGYNFIVWYNKIDPPSDIACLVIQYLHEDKWELGNSLRQGEIVNVKKDICVYSDGYVSINKKVYYFSCNSSSDLYHIKKVYQQVRYRLEKERLNGK